MPHFLTIIGGGLAGCEAAWQAASRGWPVRLYEMKPLAFSPAHLSTDLAELVCSNSFRSADPTSAVGLLKEEMLRLGSLLMQIAAETRVPAGKALAVDRVRFAAAITAAITRHPKIEVIRQEITAFPPPGAGAVIVATGPLTSPALANSLQELTGTDRLFFYDAIAPIVTAESLDREIVYAASRYDPESTDYLNCPMNEEQYLHFIEELLAAQKTPLHSFEKPKYFEGCLPIEVMAERGVETLRFGPMKPVGLPDPRTGAIAHAVVQLRKEDLQDQCYNMVGFQTKLTYPEQKRIFRMIPGMAAADFVRLGSIHRNTFICAPLVLEPTLQLKGRPDAFLAGQLTGVEGYVESTAMGLLAGINAASYLAGRPLPVPPPDTALGALISHLTASNPDTFQPSNVHFGLFPAWDKKMARRLRGPARMERALAALARWMNETGIMAPLTLSLSLKGRGDVVG